MFKKTAAVLLTCFALMACSSTSTPRIVQASSNMPEISLKAGLATQIEIPDEQPVQSVVVGNPSLLTVEHTDNIVTLMPKDGTGETNLIVRARDDDGHVVVYQYRITVQN